MTLDATASRLLNAIYGHVPDVLADGIETLRSSRSQRQPESLWTERDVVLITYADQVRDDTNPPLETLRQVLLQYELDQLLSCVHLLPFCPYTSDDGFSVVDYLAVDPRCGTWDDIARLGKSFDLMFDLVLNHSSQQHQFFQRFLSGDPEHADFYIDQDPNADLRDVVRPRSLPLLTPFETAVGLKHIWTTFSADQVDLNYANPKVMLAMLQTLVAYARRGARIIRLDAIAYLWKQPGTSCIHLPQTHAAVQLMRYVLDFAAPGTLVLTETNVPHHENISYFGDGDDEAHMVYQFSLPPLLLDAIHHGDTTVLSDWLRSLRLPSDKTTYFNFTASHDGIGVRPLEGIVPDERVEKLAEIVRKQGGRVSTRRREDGTDSPYELNITYLDAVADRSSVAAPEHAQRFLATQAIMLSIQGMPAVYFHSLVGTPNDLEGMQQSGQNRRINRRKYHRNELEQAIANPDSLQAIVFEGYRHLLKIRRQQSAFHPAASMEVLDLSGGLLGYIRSNSDQRLAVIANLSDQPQQAELPADDRNLVFDVLTGETVDPMKTCLDPYQVRWLTIK